MMKSGGANTGALKAMLAGAEDYNKTATQADVQSKKTNLSKDVEKIF